MTAEIHRFAEVDNSAAEALAERGVSFPMMGFAPGLYVQSCMTCGKRHTAAKRATTCLPCAVALTALVAAQREDNRARDYAAGRQSGLDDVRRFLAGGARSGNLVRTPMTREQREDVKRQARDADRRAADPEGASEIDDLVERTRQAQERIAAERRAAESAEPDPDGDAA